MRLSRFCLILLVVLAVSCRSKSRSSTSLSEATSDEAVLVTECHKYQSALTKIAGLTGMSPDSDLEQALVKYCSLSVPRDLEPKFGHDLLDVLMAQKWGGQITDYVLTAELLYQDNDQKIKDENDDAFHGALALLNKMRQSINRLVGAYNPGYTLLDATELRRAYQGKGVVVAVFDVFDDELLVKQRDYYRNAHIERLVKFGDPVSLNHGNVVVDVLLALAPNLTIVPVSAATKNYNEGIQYIAQRNDVAIINLSRAFLGGANDAAIDGKFAALISRMSQEKLVVKALGNTGADLEGTLNPRREAAGLGPVGDLTAYDSPLIKSYLQLVTSKSTAAPHLIFAENLGIFADKISLTATIPGSNIEAQNRTVGSAADGVYSWTTDNFEAGSSFAAPQVAALTALLMEACSKMRAVAWQQCLEPVVHAVKKSAQRPSRDGSLVRLGPDEVGCGLIAGDAALKSL